MRITRRNVFHLCKRSKSDLAGGDVLSTLQNINAHIHIFWWEIFKIYVCMCKIRCKKGFQFAPIFALKMFVNSRPNTHKIKKELMSQNSS